MSFFSCIFYLFFFSFFINFSFHLIFLLFLILMLFNIVQPLFEKGDEASSIIILADSFLVKTFNTLVPPGIFCSNFVYLCI